MKIPGKAFVFFISATSASKLAVLGVDYYTRLGGLDIITLQTGSPIVGNIDNPSMLEEGYAAQCTEINTNVGQAQIRSDINNLSASVLAVQNLFSNVSMQLAAVDALNLSSMKFSSGWATLTQGWRGILANSGTTASNVVAYTTNFTENILPSIANKSDNGAIPIANATQIIQGFIAEADFLQASALVTAQSFLNLQTNLAIFAESFKAFAQKVKMNDSNTIDQLETNIKTLNTTVDSLDTQISAVGQEIGATLLASVTVCTLFSFFAPFAIIAALIALGIETAEFDSLTLQRNADETQITADETSITTLEVHDALIARANEAMNNVMELSLDSTFRIGAFDAIWAAVRDDSHQVIDYLNDAAELPLVMWATLNNVDCYYEAMTSALRLYTQTLPSVSQASVMKTLNAL